MKFTTNHQRYTYAGPLGAQYSPVISMLKLSMCSISDLAASPGVTANTVRVSPDCAVAGGYGKFALTAAIIPKLVKADTFCHLRSHEARL